MLSKDSLNEEVTYELKKIEIEIENKLYTDNLIYKTGNKKKDKTDDFQKFKTIRSFEGEIYNKNLSLDDALEQQIGLKDEIDIFKESAKPQIKENKEKKAIILKNAITLPNGTQKVFNAFERGIFSKENRQKEKNV